MHRSTRLPALRHLAVPLLCATALLGTAAAPARAADEGFSAGLRAAPLADAGEIGLPAYPGAVEDVERRDERAGASFSLWGGNFGLDLKVLKLRSDDSVERVARYYREQLARQGRVADGERSRPGQVVLKLTVPGGVRMVSVEPAGDGGARIQLVRLLLKGD